MRMGGRDSDAIWIKVKLLLPRRGSDQVLVDSRSDIHAGGTSNARSPRKGVDVPGYAKAITSIPDRQRSW